MSTDGLAPGDVVWSFDRAMEGMVVEVDGAMAWLRWDDGSAMTWEAVRSLERVEEDRNGQ